MYIFVQLSNICCLYLTNYKKIDKVVYNDAQLNQNLAYKKS